MKYLGKISDPKDLVTKEYVDGNVGKIFYGEVDSTSTSTAFTSTISGITSYFDGLTILLKNGVVTSAANFTIDINGLGAKGSYNNMATGNDVTPTSPTRDSTIFNINYTMMFVYSTTLVDGGCWIGYRGYNSDTNTIAYQVRTNNTTLKTTDRTRYYRLLFTSADGTKWVPANTEYDNSATSTKTVNTRKINPFGRIIYYSASTNLAQGADVNASYCWAQYAFALGYSFNRTGAALTLTTQKPVYVKCAPQSDGSAIMDSTTPIVQDLPSTEDGKIYIFLGVAYSATNIELFYEHPVYYYKDGAIRLWTNAAKIPVRYIAPSTDGVQKIPVDFDGTSFTTTITPEDVIDGFTAFGESQPGFEDSAATEIYIGATGATIDERLRIELTTTCLVQSTDGIEFQSPILPLDTVGYTGEIGYLNFETYGGYNSPYILSIVHWPASVPNELPTPTSADNGKFVKVVDGEYALVNLPTYQGGVS